MTITAIIVVIIGATIAGFVQGLSGFAFSLVSMAFWAWVLPPQLAGPMAVFGSLIGQIIGLRSLRGKFRLAPALPFIAGGIAGIPIGIALLDRIDADWFKFTLGTLLVVYCPLMLVAANLPRIVFGGRLADGAIGVAGGTMGGLGGMSGAVPTLWCTLRGWPKDEQRSVVQSFNLSMHVLTLGAYAATGTITAEAGRMFLLLVPAMIVPTLIGTHVYSRFSEAAFRRLVLLLLSLSGVALLVAAVPALLSR